MEYVQDSSFSGSVKPIDPPPSRKRLEACAKRGYSGHTVRKHADAARTVLPYLLLIAAVALAAASVVVFRTPRDRQPAPELPAVETKIRRLLSLPTAEHEYRDIVYIDSSRSFLFIPTSSKRLLFSIIIRVQAGIDLSRGFSLVPGGADGRQRITVRLPRPEILLVDADEESIYQYFVREQGDRVRLLEFGDEIAKLKTRVEDDAVSRGILERAELNAKSILERFLRLQGFTEILFAPAEADHGSAGTTRQEGAGAA